MSSSAKTLHVVEIRLYNRIPTLLENSGFFWVQFPGPQKSWKMGLVLESPGNLSARFWKVLEFSRL